MKLDAIKSAWDEEYRRKGIPSSFRKEPTKPVVEFISWLKKKGFEGKVAADIGCGLGRNSFYLAMQGFKVTGIELLEENTNAMNRQAQLDDVPVYAIAQDAASCWPIEKSSLDIAIDVFCYKHIVSKERQRNYRQELWRTLAADGFYLISLASDNDGFYGPLLKTSPSLNEKLIIDPYSNIPSFLYSQDDLIREFSDLFEIIEIQEQTSMSPMHGKEFSRQVINAIFKKISA